MELAQKCLFWGGIKVYMPGALGFDRSQGGTWGEFLLLLLSWETSLGRGFFCIDSYFRETDKLNSPPLWLKAKSMLLHTYERANASMFAKLALGFTFLKEKFQFKSWSFYKVKKKNHFVSGFLWPLRIRYSSRMLNQHCWYHFDIFGFSSSWMLKRSFGI